MTKTSKVLLAGLLCLSSSVASAAKHYPGIFLGATNVDSETDVTIGIEYEYKFDDNFGVGGAYERTADGHHGDGFNVWTASLFYHPMKSVRLGIGLGEEKIGGDHPHTEDLWRLSAAYEFHVGEFEVAPTLAVDFIDDKEAYVFGVAFLMPF